MSYSILLPSPKQSKKLLGNGKLIVKLQIVILVHDKSIFQEKDED